MGNAGQQDASQHNSYSILIRLVLKNLKGCESWKELKGCWQKPGRWVPDF